MIYNGIDLPPYTGGTQERAGVRQELGVGPDERLILQVARLDSLKDHVTAVRTMARLVQRRREARLFLVGEGPMRPVIEGLIARHGLGHSVRLLGLRRDVPRLLSAADLFLLTSISEGIPLTLIEAMAAGLPVVATGVSGVPEVVEDGVPGALAPAGDGAALAEKIGELIEQPYLGEQMGRRGRDRAVALFSQEQMHGRYAQLYQELLGG